MPRVASPRRRPALKDIAARAGVSLATVSMALSDHPAVSAATRQRIRTVSQQLGYVRPRGVGRPRRARLKTDRAVFVVVGGSVDDESHTLMLQSVANAAQMQHVRLEYLSTPDPRDDDSVAERLALLGGRAGGLILYGLVSGALMARLAQARVPHVVVGRVMTDLVDVPTALTQTIHVDESAMGEQAARLMLQHGPRVAFICERVLAGLWTERWLRGYRTALALADVPFDPRLLQVTGKAFIGGEPAARALARLKPMPDGYVIPDARVAATFRQAMKSQGVKLPGERLVVSGFHPLLDRYELHDCHWIGFSPQRLGDLAVYQLRSLIERPMPCATELLVPFGRRAPRSQRG